MANFIELKPDQFERNSFNIIGKDWMLITAEKEGKVNTMTASWGGFGVIWNKNVAYIVIRPQRYTKEFVDAADSFSLTFFDKSFKKELAYLGEVSGRDENKIEKAGFTIVHEHDVPYFEEAHTAIICRKLFAQELSPDSFLDKELRDKIYPEADYHTLYVGEISKILIKE